MYHLIFHFFLVHFIVFSFFVQKASADECPSAMLGYWHLDEAVPPYKDQFELNQLSCEGICPTPISGVINGALLFDGTASGVTIPAAPMFDWSADGSFTIEFQLKRGANLSGPESVISREDEESVSLMQWWIGLNTAGKLEFSLIDRNGNGPQSSFSGNTSVADNKWHHIALVRNGATGSTLLYVDGKLDGSQYFSYPAGFQAVAPITVGWLPVAGYHFGGALDELAIYGRALSEAEISQHATDGTLGLKLGYCYDGVPIRIMPLGDSITQGTSTFTKDKKYYVGYRQDLFRGLQGKGYAIDFVGGGESAGTLAMPPFDTDHEGHPIWTDNQIADNVYSWLVAHPADLILLHVGTNNLNPDPKDVERLLDEIDRFSENAVVLLARIINRRVYSAATTSFNDNIEAMAMSRIAKGDKIILVNQENALLYPQDISEDNIHPTELGYKKMAGTWSAALEKVLPVANPLQVLKFSSEWTHYETEAGSVPESKTLMLGTLDGSKTQFMVSSDAAWLDVSPVTGASTQAEVTVSVKSASLPAGIYTAYVTASATGYVNAVTKITLAVTTANSGYQLLTSTSADRSGSIEVGDSVLSGNAYVFVTGSTSNVRRVIFSLDGTAVMTESGAPYDFAGTAADGTAKPFDTRRLTDGEHVISAVVQFYGGASKAVSSTVTVSNTTASLTTNPAGLQFSAQLGGVPPGEQTITVAASDDGVAPFSASSNAGWLAVSPLSATTPETLTVSVNDTGLAPGTYNGLVTLSASGYAGTTVPVTYTLTATAPSDSLTASPGSLQFAAQQGSSLPGAQSIAVAASDGGTAVLSASTNASWLTVSPLSGSTPASISISVNNTNLAPGTYDGTVTLSANGYVGATVAVTYVVSAAVASPYELLVSNSADRSNALPLAGSVLSGNAYVFVTGPTKNVRRVIFSIDGTAVMTESGAPYDFAGTAPDGTSKPYDTKQLTDGMHMISAVIQYFGGVTESVSAAFTVSNNSIASLTASPGSFQFNAQQGGALPGAQTITVAASDDGVSQFSASSNAGWLAVSPLSATTPETLTVSVNDTGLAPGTYNGLVTLSASGYAGTAVPVTYTLTAVGPSDSLTASPGSLQFAAQQGSSLPGAQSIAVTVSDGEAPMVSASTDASWLTVSPLSGSTPASISISVNNTNLAPGTYDGTVTLSASGYVGATVAVTYVVSAAVASPYELLVSNSADRLNALPLAGSVLSGNAYVFVTGPTKNVRRVIFSLDGTAVMTEYGAPYDFSGTASDGTSKSYDTKQLTDGMHMINAVIQYYGGVTESVSAAFTVSNAPSM
jgi:lysophospholipase L1-like esterase